MGWRARAGAEAVMAVADSERGRIRSCFVYLFRRKIETSLEEKLHIWRITAGRHIRAGIDCYDSPSSPEYETGKVGNHARAEGRILRETKKASGMCREFEPISDTAVATPSDLRLSYYLPPSLSPI